MLPQKERRDRGRALDRVTWKKEENTLAQCPSGWYERSLSKEGEREYFLKRVVAPSCGKGGA